MEVAEGPSLSLAGRGEPLHTAGLSLGRDRPRCALLSVSIPRARCGGSRGAGARPGPASRGRRGGCWRPGARGAGQHCALQVELGLCPARAAEGCGCELRLLLPALLVQPAQHWCSDGGNAASSSPAPSSGLNAPHVDAHQVSFPLDDSQVTCSLNYI